jgi:NAD(P)-dependent dehydrogenase (short-subunit alcohol dehydrogenase family)
MDVVCGARVRSGHAIVEGGSVQDFAGKTAFVTGGASGIGLAMARAFLDAGMNVMLADIEDAALQEALRTLSNHGPRVAGTLCDVSVRDALERAAAAAFAAYGKVHLVCNNAGVSRAGPVERIAPDDWEWVIGVNLMGAVNGIRIFLPHMKAHGEDGHIVNTASIAGVVGSALSGPYSASKFAIVGLSEVLADELAGSNIGVSVLCPGMIRTRMVDNGRNRPVRFGGSFDLAGDVANAERNARFLAANKAGLDPDLVPPMVLQAIRENRLYIFTHPEREADVEVRFQRLRAGFDALRRAPPHGKRTT